MSNIDPKSISSKKKGFLCCFTDLMFFVFGAVIFGLGINMFAVPNNISNGGATGIATVINHYFPFFPIGAAIFAVNVPLFMIAFMFLGKRFFLKSFAATVIMSAVTDLIKPYLPCGTENRLLAAVFYGVCTGLGLSLILMRGATTGGSDIPAKLINKKFPHISLGRAVFAVDCVVVAVSGFAFGSIEDALYAAIVVFISGETVDMILYGMDRAKTFLIVTDNPDKMAHSITCDLKRGVSSVLVRGGYTGQARTMLICAVRASEVSRLNKIIRLSDDSAFTIVLEAGEIMGEGFLNKG